jgi:hypothetical protein
MDRASHQIAPPRVSVQTDCMCVGESGRGESRSDTTIRATYGRRYINI